MTLFLAITMGIFAVYWIYLSVRPLAEKGVFSAEEWSQLEDDSSKLISRRDRLIEELRDIEFEAALNKVDPRDLAALKQRYEVEAVKVMGALEEEVDRFGERIEADISGVLKRHKRASDDSSEAAREYISDSGKASVVDQSAGTQAEVSPSPEQSPKASNHVGVAIKADSAKGDSGVAAQGAEDIAESPGAKA